MRAKSFLDPADIICCSAFLTPASLLCLQILSRSKPAQPAGAAGGGAVGKERKKKRLPKLEDFVQSRDYAGAITLLEVSVQR